MEEDPRINEVYSTYEKCGKELFKERGITKEGLQQAFDILDGLSLEDKIELAKAFNVPARMLWQDESFKRKEK